jgi:hypothetical protein
MIDYHYLDLPDELTLDSVLRIGHVEASVRTFIKCGMIRQDGPRFIKTNQRHIISTSPADSPNPFSLKELQKRGFLVLQGKTEEDDRVMIQAGAYYRITDALKQGLLNETTQPFNKSKE